MTRSPPGGRQDWEGNKHCRTRGRAPRTPSVTTLPGAASRRFLQRLQGAHAPVRPPLPCGSPRPSATAPLSAGVSAPFLWSYSRPSARPSRGHHTVRWTRRRTQIRPSGPGWLRCDAGRVSSPLRVSASSSLNEEFWPQRPRLLGASKQGVSALVPPLQQSGLCPMRPEVHAPRSFP